MQARVEQFQQTHGRSPTDFEFYVLWNAPAEVDHPVPCVAERARRFVNLVERDEPSDSGGQITSQESDRTRPEIPAPVHRPSDIHCTVCSQGKTVFMALRRNCRSNPAVW